MSRKRITNLPASVRRRLLNLSHQGQEDFNLLLGQYANERLLYRLSQSPFVEQFVLKGAMLFALWTGELHRPTRDLDLLGYGRSDQESLIRLFTDLCQLEVEADGLAFDPDSVGVAEIRETQEYGGQRVRLMATLDNVRISLQIDIGFGDIATPPARYAEYPTLLNFSPPRLRVYPQETVIAEKLHAMVVLGIRNSRMKDFFDLWILSRRFSFDGRVLSHAIQATFYRRQTAIPSTLPVALTPEFGVNPQKSRQWQTFLKRNRLENDAGSFANIVNALDHFLASPLQAAGQTRDFDANWPPGGPWSI